MVNFLSNSNIWYYTLSTSAQVIAAIYGLTAVFVVYKIQTLEPVYSEIKNAMRKIISAFNSAYGDSNDLNDILKLDSDQKIVDEFEIVLKKKNEGAQGSHLTITTDWGRLDIKRSTIKAFNFYRDKRKSIFNKFGQISIISVISILFCLTLLAFAEPNIYTYKYFTTCMVAVTVAVIGSAISVFEISKE